MPIQKPIWCKCGGHSWTRRQLLSAWEQDKTVRCPSPDCQRDIPLELIKELLVRLDLIHIDDEASDDVESS